MATVKTHSEERRFTPDRRASSYRTGNRLNALDWTSVVLLIIGGINWGLIGLFGFNLVGAIFGEMSVLSRIIYIVVGLAALYSIYTSSKMSAARRTV